MTPHISTRQTAAFLINEMCDTHVLVHLSASEQFPDPIVAAAKS